MTDFHRKTAENEWTMRGYSIWKRNGRWIPTGAVHAGVGHLAQGGMGTVATYRGFRSR